MGATEILIAMLEIAQKVGTIRKVDMYGHDFMVVEALTDDGATFSLHMSLKKKEAEENGVTV